MINQIGFFETVKALDNSGQLPALDYARRAAFFDVLYSVDVGGDLSALVADLFEQMALSIGNKVDADKEAIEAYLFEDDGDNAANYFDCFKDQLTYYADNVNTWLMENLDSELLCDERDHIVDQVAHDMISQKICFRDGIWNFSDAILSLSNEGEEYAPINDGVAQGLIDYERLYNLIPDYMRDDIPDLATICQRNDIVAGEQYGLEGWQYEIMRPQQICLVPCLDSLRECLADYREDKLSCEQ